MSERIYALKCIHFEDGFKSTMICPALPMLLGSKKHHRNGHLEFFLSEFTWCFLVKHYFETRKIQHQEPHTVNENVWPISVVLISNDMETNGLEDNEILKSP